MLIVLAPRLPPAERITVAFSGIPSCFLASLFETVAKAFLTGSPVTVVLSFTLSSRFFVSQTVSIIMSTSFERSFVVTPAKALAS